MTTPRDEWLCEVCGGREESVVHDKDGHAYEPPSQPSGIEAGRCQWCDLPIDNTPCRERSIVEGDAVRCKPSDTQAGGPRNTGSEDVQSIYLGVGHST